MGSNEGAVAWSTRQEPPQDEVRAAPAVVEVEGGPGQLSIASLRELWAFREVLAAFTLRHVKVRYKQAVVGVGWAFVQPVVSAAVIAVVLGRFANVPSEGAPYLLFALAGMVLWTYFSGASNTATNSLVADQSLLRKVYFPREILPIAAVLAALLDLTAGLVTLVVAALAYGAWPSLPWLAMPIPIGIVVVSAAAFGVGFAAVNVYYRDARYALPFLLQLGLFASPVVYPLSALPERWQVPYAVLNPIAGAIDAMRHIVLHAQWPNWGPTLGALVWAMVGFVGAAWLFKRLERGFADRV